MNRELKSNDANFYQRNCFWVKNGRVFSSFSLSEHVACSVTKTERLYPLPDPLCLFCFTISRRSSWVMFSHSSVLFELWNHFRKARRALWQGLHLLVWHRTPPHEMESFKATMSSQSIHLSRQWYVVVARSMYGMYVYQILIGTVVTYSLLHKWLERTAQFNQFNLETPLLCSDSLWVIMTLWTTRHSARWKSQRKCQIKTH